MKKIIFTISLLSACYAGVSQNNNIVPNKPIEQSIFSLGITGGIGHSFLTPYSNYRFHASWDAGLSAIYSPWKHWGIGLDVIYSSEGWTLHNGDVNSSSQVDYFRFPLKAIYFFKDYESDFRPKIALGPTFGIMNNQVNISAVTGTDLGATASLGFNYRLMRAVWLNADLSYYQGFIDVFKYNDYNNLNGNVRLNLGLSLGF